MKISAKFGVFLTCLLIGAFPSIAGAMTLEPDEVIDEVIEVTPWFGNDLTDILNWVDGVDAENEEVSLFTDGPINKLEGFEEGGSGDPDLFVLATGTNSGGFYVTKTGKIGVSQWFILLADNGDGHLIIDPEDVEEAIDELDAQQLVSLTANSKNAKKPKPNAKKPKPVNVSTGAFSYVVYVNVPEPGILALFGAGLVALGLARSRRAFK